MVFLFNLLLGGQHKFISCNLFFSLITAPDLGSDDVLGVWKIDDMDHSFSSQPFRIRYARQDILLSVMISFNLSLGKFEVSFSLCAISLFSCLNLIK